MTCEEANLHKGFRKKLVVRWGCFSDLPQRNPSGAAVVTTFPIILLKGKNFLPKKPWKVQFSTRPKIKGVKSDQGAKFSSLASRDQQDMMHAVRVLLGIFSSGAVRDKIPATKCKMPVGKLQKESRRRGWLLLLLSKPMGKTYFLYACLHSKLFFLFSQSYHPLHFIKRLLGLSLLSN